MGLFDRLFERAVTRKQKMRKVSIELNLKYRELNDTGMHQQLSEFKLFDKGISRKITNTISESELNSENHVFDYKYVISAGNHHKTYNQTVLFINSKELSLPQFHQKPETIFTKLMAAFGLEDIDFENFPEYSKKYRLKGEFEEVIRYYFTKEILELLTTQKDLYMEGMNYYFILYQHDKLCPPSQINAFRNLGLMLYKLFLLRSKESDDLLE